MIKNPSISSIISQLNFIKDNYDFITQSKSFLHTLSLEQKKNQICILDIKSNEKGKRFLSKKRNHSQKLQNELLNEEDFL